MTLRSTIPMLSVRVASGVAILFAVSLLVGGADGLRVWSGVSASARGAGTLCFGEVPTIVGEPGVHRIFGTDGPDVIVAAPGDNAATQIYAGGGDDLICDDFAPESGDSNFLVGGPGDDKLRGGARLEGGPGDDVLVPVERSGDDPISLKGGKDDDVLLAGPEPDVYLDVATGHDVVHGSGEVCDVLDPASCDTALVDGTVDLAAGRASSRLGTAGLFGISAASGFIGPDVFSGSSRAEYLDGGQDGDDTISGRGGADLIDGLSADDQLRGGDGNDTVQGAYGADRLHGGAGRDTLRGGAGKDVIDGGAGRDTCGGNRQFDTFRHCEVIVTEGR